MFNSKLLDVHQVCICIPLHMYMYMYMYATMYLCMYLCIYIYIHVYVCICMRVPTTVPIHSRDCYHVQPFGDDSPCINYHASDVTVRSLQLIHIYILYIYIQRVGREERGRGRYIYIHIYIYILHAQVGFYIYRHVRSRECVCI